MPGVGAVGEDAIPVILTPGEEGKGGAGTRSPRSLGGWGWGREGRRGLSG